MKRPLNPLLTKEELTLIKEYVLFPIVLDVLAKDTQTLKLTQLKMGSVYLSTLAELEERLTAELAGLRRRLTERGIRVYEPERDSSGVKAIYLYHGYQYTFFMLWRLVKAEVEKVLRLHLALK